METANRIALVTGATSGIGRAIAGHLSAVGHPVFICARDAARVGATVKTLRAEGADAAGTACDVRSTDQVRSCVGAAAERFGRVDILVNSAGRSGGGVTAGIGDDRWSDVIDTNLNGTFRMTREVLSAGMAARGWGRVIN